MTTAYKNLIAALKSGKIESKKQQDHLFKILNGQNDETKNEMKAIFRDNEGFKLSEYQNKQAQEWLTNLWKTPNGKERKNNPFGYREQAALENFSHCELVDYYSGNFSGYVVPVYDVIAKDGYGFQYHTWGGTIQIVG